MTSTKCLQLAFLISVILDVTFSSIPTDLGTTGDNSNQNQQNLLLLKKRSVDPAPLDVIPEDGKENSHGLNRRDYREFVRFGKRSLPSDADAVRTSRSHPEHAKPRSFLRFGKRDFEATMTSDNRVPKLQSQFYPLPNQNANRNQLVYDQDRQLWESLAKKRRDDFLRFGKRPVSSETLCLEYGLCHHDTFVEKKSNDFLRFG